MKAGLIARSQDAGSVNFELTNFAAASNELLEISTAFGSPVEPLVQIIRPESILQGIETSIADSYLFAKDSPLYIDSVFQTSWTFTNEYAPIDKDLIRLLYHPEMRIGLNDLQVDKVLRGILINE
jgi:hypothetical protein